MPSLPTRASWTLLHSIAFVGAAAVLVHVQVIVDLAVEPLVVGVVDVPGVQGAEEVVVVAAEVVVVAEAAAEEHEVVVLGGVWWNVI
jgi:acyl CoA:acetate/3-ketoacid CoA transferase beta subunit